MPSLRVLAGTVLILLLAGCASSSEPASSPSASAPFPVASDGSIITPSGFVFQSTFAICNQAECTVTPGQPNATCTCAQLTDTWTLSPVPKVTLEALTTSTALLSTFTTANVANASSIPCSGGEWADCYGATCAKDPATGEVTCDCPIVTENPGNWVKYVDDCGTEGCGSGLVSAAPVFPAGSTGFTDYATALEQAGQPKPELPGPCVTSSPTSTTEAAGCTREPT